MKKRYLAIPFIVLLVFLAFVMLTMPSTENIVASLEVTSDDKLLGFNANPDGLHFGKVPKGGFAEKKVFIDNEDHFTKKVEFRVGGDLAEWMSFSENNFYIEFHQNKTVAVRIKVPFDANNGNYTSKVIVLTTRKWL